MIPAYLQVHITDELRQNEPLPSLDARTYYSHDGLARLHLDPAEFDCYIDCSPEADPIIAQALARAACRRGWTPIPEEDTPAVMTDDGFVRIWLEPIEPISGPCHFDDLLAMV